MALFMALSDREDLSHLKNTGIAMVESEPGKTETKTAI